LETGLSLDRSGWGTEAEVSALSDCATSGISKFLRMDFFRRCCFCVVLFAAGLAGRAQSTVPTLSLALPGQTMTAGGANATLDLRNHFTVPGVTGQVAQFDTVLGKFNAMLLSADAPKTVTNFLNYVNRGAYTNSLIHRSVPGFVIQGGGFALSGSTLNAIPTDAPVTNEFKVPNTRGTLAMAKTADGPNTATSQWFVNLADNRSNLDSQNGGFTVFASVLGTGMTVADAIAAVQVYDVSGSLGGTFTQLPLLAPALTPANLILIRSIKIVPLFPATSGGDAVAVFSATSSNPAIVTATVSGSSLVLAPVAAGSATITVLATDVNSNSATGTIAVTVNAATTTAPSFTTQPVSQTVTAGTSVTLTAAASGTPAPAYQWKKGGTDIAGATGATLAFSNATAYDAGTYTVTATNSAGSVTSNAATLTVSALNSSGSYLANLSVRVAMATGQTLIVGFVVDGGAKPMLVRAAGPVLSQFGLTGVVDPQLKLFNASNTQVAINDNWDSALASNFAALGAFAFDAGSKDAALLQTINGPHSAQATATGAGALLVEAYDAGPNDGRKLVNLSTRFQVGTGDNILITGFVLSGTGPKQVLVRAVGPKLTDFGVTGVLADPQLSLFEGNTQIASNDNWSSTLSATFSALGAFALNAGSKDAAIVVTLQAGKLYSVQISGAGSTTGEALAEIYVLP
jgi:cyclophilin family peptidyl-prolyl cis-trans isomerase